MKHQITDFHIRVRGFWLKICVRHKTHKTRSSVDTFLFWKWLVLSYYFMRCGPQENQSRLKTGRRGWKKQGFFGKLRQKCNLSVNFSKVDNLSTNTTINGGLQKMIGGPLEHSSNKTDVGEVGFVSPSQNYWLYGWRNDFSIWFLWKTQVVGMFPENYWAETSP